MENNSDLKTKTISIEKLNHVIENINKVSEKRSSGNYESIAESEQIKDEELLKKYSNYIKKRIDFIAKLDNKEIINFLTCLLKLSPSSIKLTGEEFTEGLWKLYDDKIFNIDKEEFAFTYYEYFLHLFFLNSKNLDILIKHQLFVINKENRKIESYFTFEKFNDISNELKLNNSADLSSLITHKNFLIDLLLLLTFTNVDIRFFYTSLSTFIVTSESNVMLLFKVLSLFSLCLWQFESKEKFLGALLYIIGGVLRDYGKSYLKTKGILEQNLSYHQCPPTNKHHETQFFAPKILTTKESDYLELYFLPIMIEFIKTIVSHIKYESLTVYWDDNLPLFNRLLAQKDSDSEEPLQFLPEVQIFHYLNLFLSDILFFFLTNFACWDNKQFTSNFSYFDDFINYSLSVFSRGCRNVLNLFEMSHKKRKFFEFECEKTEYTMKDSFNHYGVCLIFYLFLQGGYSPVNVLNEKDFVLESSFIPLVINKKHYFSLFLSDLLMILRTENLSEYRFMKEYQKFSWNFLEGVIEMADATLMKEIDKQRHLAVEVIFEFSRFEEKSIRYDLLERLVDNVLKEQKEHLPKELEKLTSREDETLKIKKLCEKLLNH